MDTSENRNDKAPDDPATPEEGLVQLIEEHRAEAIKHDLAHKGLLAEPHPPDHDARHADPLKPSAHFTPDPHPPTRDIL